MDSPTLQFYEQNAGSLRIRYGEAEEGMAHGWKEFFSPGEKILDVGCGTGRDCAILLDRGVAAYGVDPSPAMLSEADRTLLAAGHSTEGRLFKGTLPRLDVFEDASFDGILCNAVLMHLPEEQIFDAIYTFKRILKAGGKLALSIPETRDDVDPKTRRAKDKRFFNKVDPRQLELLCERIGFSLVSSEISQDGLGRSGIIWHQSRFRLLDDVQGRPLQQIETILNRDDKVATYKLALIRALADIAQTQQHQAIFLPNGKVALPNRILAEKWLLYYWPLFESDQIIRQGTSRGASDVAIRQKITALVNHFKVSGGLDAFYVDRASGRLTPEAVVLEKEALSKIASTIWSMPVKHAGGGDFSVFQYDRAGKSILMNASLWREFTLMAIWIHDATILRWAELTERFNHGAFKASQIVDHLLKVPNEKRNVEDARKYFLSLAERRCVWTDKKIIPEKLAIDHAIPFSLWRNNDLWNLLPADSSANNSKSDKLPTYKVLQARKDCIIHYWTGLSDTLGPRFHREAQTLMGSRKLNPKNWERPLFARFTEAFETTASQRSVPRWSPSEFQFTTGKASSESDSISKIPKPRLTNKAQPAKAVLKKTEQSPARIEIVPNHEVGTGKFVTHLPFLTSLAAGDPFRGFHSERIEGIEDLDWVKVPSEKVKPKRFVVRVGGDSMEPDYRQGEYLLFEYHRNPRSDRQIVIANIPAFGAGSTGVEAIKQIEQTPHDWVFHSINPRYEPIKVSKSEIAYPILGILVDRLRVL